MKQIAGAILLGMIGQMVFARDGAHLRLQYAAQREHGFAQLLLVQPVKKITLVLAVVVGLEQLEQPILFAHLGVMARGNFLRTQTDGVVEEGFELDFRVAQDIRVGRAPGFVFAQEVAEYALLVFLGEIHRLDRNADGVGDRHRVDQVLARRAIFAVVIVLPILHEQADDLIALLLQQQRSDSRVNAAGHADNDTGFSRHGIASSFPRRRESSRSDNTPCNGTTCLVVSRDVLLLDFRLRGNDGGG